MIASDMRNYTYSTIQTTLDSYGQETISPIVGGSIKMAIYSTNQYLKKDSIAYSGADYIGLTHNSSINDKYIIDYGTEKLKVKYVNQFGNYRQVFMVRE